MVVAAQKRVRLVSGFLERVREPEARHISPERLIRELGVTVTDLARYSRVNRNTITRHPKSSKLQERLSAIVQVIGSASEITGDEDRAIAWFKYQPIAAHGFKTPADLVADGNAAALLAFLEDCRNGAYA
jgi:uncharacterized protein (DUF2384 family)